MLTQSQPTLSGRTLYHTTPLHYVPSILLHGALLSQQKIGASMGRPGARSRDRRLGVDRHVHFSLAPFTPLLKDKLAKGYPHVLLEFEGSKLENAAVSLLPCSTKAWRSRWQCRPVTDPVDMLRLIRQFDDCGRWPGLEVLIEGHVPLSALTSITVFDQRHQAMLQEVVRRFGKSLDIEITFAPGMAEQDCSNEKTSIVQSYYARCLLTGTCLPVPLLVFD